MLERVPIRWKWFLVVGLLTLSADHASKIWAKSALLYPPACEDELNLPDDRERADVPDCAVGVIPNFWDMRLSYNTGSAFGLFSSVTGARIFLTIVGFIALGAILWMVYKGRDDQRRLMLGLGLVGGGAIGNVIDRVAFGKVTDFVVWRWYSHEWPTFNVADAALCVGVGLLFLDLGKQAKEEKAKQDAEKAAAKTTKPQKKKKG
jgi:signal peptidase II